jgi:hypothetical protein
MYREKTTYFSPITASVERKALFSHLFAGVKRKQHVFSQMTAVIEICVTG